MPPVVGYTLARLGIFLLVWVPLLLISLLWLEFGTVSVLWTMLIAWVVSALLSFVVLRDLRDRLAKQTESGVARARRRFQHEQRKEDLGE